MSYKGDGFQGAGVFLLNWLAMASLQDVIEGGAGIVAERFEQLAFAEEAMPPEFV